MSIMSVKYVYGFVRILGLVSVMLYSFIGRHISFASYSYACFDTKNTLSIKNINIAFARGMHKTEVGLTDVSCPCKVKNN